AGEVAARPIEAGDEAGLDRISAVQENDRDRRGRGFGSERGRRAAGYAYDGHPAADQIGHQFRQPIAVIVAQRYSMTTLRPSTNPVSLSPLRNVVTRLMADSDGLGLRNPTTGSAGCCARAAGGQAIAAPPSNVMIPRR